MYNLVVFSLDSSALGRLDTTCLPQQTLMELFVTGFDDKAVFRDSEGYFRDFGKWKGVGTRGGTEVLSIDWEQGMNLFGDSSDEEEETINYGLPKAGGSVNLALVPPTVQELTIPGLKLRGTIDTGALPRSLITFDIDDNAFEGVFETKLLPRGLLHVYLGNNKLIGSLNLRELPPKLKGLYAQDNHFEGSLDFTCLPNTLSNLNVARNEFQGCVDLTSVERALTFLKIEGNNLTLPKVLTVREGGILHLIVDRGEIEEVRDTLGVKLKMWDYNNAKAFRVSNEVL